MEDATSGEFLLKLMGRFFQYSSAFAPCQACLSGYIAVRKDLFNSPCEVGVFADRSPEIGAGVFFGAIDEFGEQIRQHGPTNDAINKVYHSGGINTVVDEAHLFRGIGFRLGTEVLGEEENLVLEEFFHTKERARTPGAQDG